jgi:chromosome partition protein MukB
MSRARAVGLVLVNWKGVFYERYQLDRRVTALEGANGAGKTTVMIAAYVVLLPDMTRLRFTNLGETAATGGDRGIWGRLGEQGRPSYAALELDLGDGVRVVAGVLLTRKSEPAVELTPFLITQLSPSVRLQDLLLVLSAEEEAVPELGELRENVSRAGARLQVFASGKDYFAALFELGIGALRLSSDEDRGRLGDMLRTSMTGGISRAITAELRSFLLREQGGLGDTLGRMRENLNTCRRTRTEVSEAQLLEQEISGVYDAGQGMFGAALQATRERAREHGDAESRLLGNVGRSRQALDDSARVLGELEARESELGAQLKQQRKALDELRERARLASSLQGVREKHAALALEREAALAVVGAQRLLQAEASSERDAAKRRREIAQQDQERAALGLADLQAGLDELHRRSSAYRKAQRALADVTALSAQPPDLTALPARLLEARAELSELDTGRLTRERALTLAQQRRSEWQQALQLLSELGGGSEPEQAFERARDALRRAHDLAAELAKKPQLAAELGEQERLSARQTAAQTAALACGLELAPGSMLQRIEARLGAADAELLRLEAQQRALEDERRRTNAERSALLERLTQTQAQLGKHRRLLQRVERINAVAGGFSATREALLRLRDSLSSERQELSAKLEQLGQTRERWLREANQFEAAGGQFPAELLKLRDELDGELLGNRFEELDLAEASRLEALLGPLAHAIVVDDVQAAAERLRDKPRELSELRLVAAGTELDFLRQETPKNALDVCVSEGPALRITRRPERATLGRKARETRVEELRRQAAETGGQLEQLQARSRAVSGALSEIDQLLPDAELLERGDPANVESALRTDEQQLANDERALDQSITELALRVRALQQESGRYRGLLSEAFLLDAESHADRARELAAQLTRLDASSAELTRSASVRRQLEPLLEALRVPPPSAEELARFESERQALADARDRVFQQIDALERLLRELPALAWEDAERSLASRAQVAPALDEQHQRARGAMEASELAVQTAETAWELATNQLQRAEATLAAVSAHAERLAPELESLGAASELSSERAAQRLAELESGAERLTLDERELLARRGAQTERARQLEQALAEAERLLDSARQHAGPAAERWRTLRERAEAAHVLQSGESSEHGEPPSAIELWAEARSRSELLGDRLAAARGGEGLARELSELSLDDGQAFLSCWLKVREWLARRVPAQVAEVDDPLLSLERLRGHLSVLEQRLSHQESDLRGASEDVARGIEVQLRRAKAQVRRLNQNLAGVSFGSIAGIRVELRRAQQMEPVLRALAEGSVQELLFQSSLPMEEALSEILRRYGGGRSGGARVLDYREYLELVVEVQRKADGNWEPANPTRLSTGEAIGVGAALMMVVLAEWERDANLLRSRRGSGSLRFLFLDEANRLSQDNLGSLFDLCESLDLQLLIAAPEVARTEGNTTYRLVRKVTEDGREEVIVSGRRSLTAEPLPSAAAPSPQVVQGVLF